MDDDVREALGRLGSHARHGEIYGRPATVVEVSDLRLVLDAFTAEVRPHGTVPAEQVSDAEVEAALVSLDTDWVWPSHEAMRAALKAAREV